MFARIALIALTTVAATTALIAAGTSNVALRPLSAHVDGGSMDVTVLDRRASGDTVRAEVMLFDVFGRSVGGYGRPFAPADVDVSDLWRSYVVDKAWVRTSAVDIDVKEIRSDETSAYAVAFVLDRSLSMTHPRAVRMQQAVQRALDMFEPQDHAAVVKFTSKVKTEVELTNDRDEYMADFQVNGVNPRSDGTAIYDGIDAAFDELDDAPDGVRRVIIVFTDGDDNSSSETLDDVLQRAAESHTTVFAVTYGVPVEHALVRLASASGGRVHRLQKEEEFDQVFTSIYSSLRHRYMVTITPSHDDEFQKSLDAPAYGATMQLGTMR